MGWKRKSDIGMTEFYDYYKKNNFSENTDSLFFMTRKEYNKIVTDLFTKIKDALIYENFEFNIPFRMGTICIRKIKRKVKIKDGKVIATLPINWKATLDLWESNPEAKEKKVLVKHINEHSGGYVANYKYFKKKANYKNKSIYFFKPARGAAREINTAWRNKKNNIDYYEL